MIQLSIIKFLKFIKNSLPDVILSVNINLTYAHVPAISKAVNNAVMIQWNDAKKLLKLVAKNHNF